VVGVQAEREGVRQDDDLRRASRSFHTAEAYPSTFPVCPYARPHGVRTIATPRP
jgi:hypothetical protein